MLGSYPPELRDLRNHNKELIGQIGALAREPRSDVLTEAEVREKERAVVSLRASYNNWRGRSLARQKHIEKLNAEWEVYRSSDDAFSAVNDFYINSDAAVTLQRVPRLSDVKAFGAGAGPKVEKNLDAMSTLELRAAFEEATHRLQLVEGSVTIAKQTKATLEHMINRFKGERMGQETKYEEIKESISAIVRQEKEHVLQVKMVGHEEDVARSKIGALQEQLSKVSAKRIDLVVEEKSKLATKAELENYVKGRGSSRKTIADNVAGDLTITQETELRKTGILTTARQVSSAVENERAAKLEEAFSSLLKVTGDANITLFVNRFLSMNDSLKHAKSSEKELEERAHEARCTLGILRQQLGEIQNVGINFPTRRDEFDKLEDELNEKEKREARLNASSDTLNNFLSNLRVGVYEFASKLKPISMKLGEENSASPASSDDTVICQLEFIGNCIERMLATLKPSEDVDSRFRGPKQRDRTLSSNAILSGGSEDDIPKVDAVRAVFEYNFRVKEGSASSGNGSRTADFDDFEDGPVEDDGYKPRGAVPLGDGYESVAGLAREAKEAVMKRQRKGERQRLRQAKGSTRGKNPTLSSSHKTLQFSSSAAA